MSTSEDPDLVVRQAIADVHARYLDAETDPARGMGHIAWSSRRGRWLAVLELDASELRDIAQALGPDDVRARAMRQLAAEIGEEVEPHG